MGFRLVSLVRERNKKPNPNIRVKKGNRKRLLFFKWTLDHTSELVFSAAGASLVHFNGGEFIRIYDFTHRANVPSFRFLSVLAWRFQVLRLRNKFSLNF